jgi:hypothetical protein
MPAPPQSAAPITARVRRRVTPVTFVRPLTARVGGAPRPVVAASVASTLRTTERVSTHTTLVTRVVQATAAHETPAPRVLHRPAEERSHQDVQTDQPSAPAPMRPPIPPTIDVARLSDEVYRHIQRRVRIERERRGA